jgi:hypothetical protein
MDAALAAETYDLSVKMLSSDGLMSDESILAAMEIFSDNPRNWRIILWRMLSIFRCCTR